ncbi:type II secretion system major pseudopilin GspG [Stratiformator vulcanicus]|uniref:Type II secretion system core protein G n=1 Tax=Stratiformator vulcanicus TaxID=2527980 RepID=A0A517R259_9PLAN|nr:type II secretion system major pseudopilin GspG [Stratiformator vulcanicus]QDT37944.1 Type II secretion system protein G precursor [Stratiformator vulcanicus]
MKSHNIRIRRAGFTLLEVLLVLAILGVIAAMVVPQLLGRQKKAMIDTTKNSISAMEQAAKLYAIDHDGEYPQGGQDAVALLLEPVDDDGKAIEPYLEKTPADAWETPLLYEYPNSKGGRATKPAIWSAGPNKRNEDGGGDDINNWSET